MTMIRESRTPQLGRDHSYDLDPPPDPQCVVHWSIDGVDARVGLSSGGLEIVGVSTSHLQAKVVNDPLSADIRARIVCPNKPEEALGPMAAGSVRWPPFPGSWKTLNDYPLEARLSGECPPVWAFSPVWRCPCTKTITNFAALRPFRLWPVLYDVRCEYTCEEGEPPTIVTWTLSFGVVVSGPP
jgi:hypothetical protein